MKDLREVIQKFDKKDWITLITIFVIIFVISGLFLEEGDIGARMAASIGAVAGAFLFLASKK